LDVSANFLRRVSFHDFGISPFPPFPKYDWREETERAGYPHLLQYLTVGCGLVSKDVSDGVGLPSKNLFDHRVFSLRERLVDGTTLRDEGKIPAYKFHICGRTDFIVLDENITGKSHIMFAIEVKTVEAMSKEASENQSLREAFLQLIGISVGNSYKSPPVILTNLHSKHYILYLSIRGDPEASFSFDLNIHKSSNLHELIHFANALGKRPSITSKLGTMLTPLVSEQGDLGNEYSSVQVTVNPDEGIEGLPETTDG
jgi:hypothetical protein